MELSSVSVDSDDREEGEIVDDDFEDISDNSIIVPLYTGKSVSSKEHLCALSLSSVSDREDRRDGAPVRRRRKTSNHLRRTKHVKKRRVVHRRPTHNSDLDSDDDYPELDKKLQKRLKAAVRIDESEDLHRNSLSARLKAMTKLVDEDLELNTIEPIQDVVEGDVQKSSDVPQSNDFEVISETERNEIDNELIQLRLEALRTAVLNKHVHRKKRKAKENGILSDASQKSETNKENTHNENAFNEEPQLKKPCIEQNVEKNDKDLKIVESNTIPEEDEDVMRAVLLASISKKITKENVQTSVLPVTNNKGLSESKLAYRANVKAKIAAMAAKNETLKGNKKISVLKPKTVCLPKVKPLIINVNSDSDSDEMDQTLGDAVKQDSNLVKMDIQSTVDRFLKEQRARVEAKLTAEPKTPMNNNKKSPITVEKSAVKLLPKFKQIEYQKLLQKIKNAEKKPRIRRVSSKLNGGKAASVRTVKTKLTNSKSPLATKLDRSQEQKKTDSIGMLNKSLKDIQIHKNGSFIHRAIETKMEKAVTNIHQMRANIAVIFKCLYLAAVETSKQKIQENYKVLSPILKKINEANVARKKHSQHITRLNGELAEVKKLFTKSNQEFASSVRDFLTKKEEIEQKIDIQSNEQKLSHFTSRTAPVILENLQSFSEPESVLLNSNIPNSFVHQINSETTVTIGDPNDIDKIINMQSSLDSKFSKYVSPLDNIKRWYITVNDDPLAIVCPYEVSGMCRDPECSFKHIVEN